MTSEVTRRPLFEGSATDELWIEGQSQFPDSKVLLTVSNAHGEKTVLITPTDIAPTKAKMFVQAPPERVATPAQKRVSRAGSIMRGLGYLLSGILIAFSVLSASGFIKARIVLTGSMEPTINVGDIVILRPTAHLQPHVGDVVAYTGRRFSGEEVGIFTHRIIGGDPVNGFLMKGDANPNPDVQQPTLDDISGTVVFVVPLIGKFMTPKMLMILIPIAVGIWLIIDTLKSDG